MPSPAKFCFLPDRGVVSVAGPDAAKLLQGIITNDMARLDSEQALFAGLLSPQGKIQFDFIVVPLGQDFLLDVARDKADELVKRLQLYRLRAKAEIADVSKRFAVAASWGEACVVNSATRVRDPRLAALGERIIIAPQSAAQTPGATPDDASEIGAYHVHRIGFGVPEGGRDFAFGDAFPHEACMDQLNGVSFTKGCYVGQEIVSRMEHRGTARKRVVPVVSAATLPVSGTDITAGDVAIGTLGSTAGTRGLALIRLDRAAQFTEQGVPLMAGDAPVAITKPAWATFDLDPRKTAEAAGSSP